jgi:hypothetical protein
MAWRCEELRGTPFAGSRNWQGSLLGAFASQRVYHNRRKLGGFCHA